MSRHAAMGEMHFIHYAASLFYVIKRDDEKDFFCATIVACGLPAFVGGS